MILYGNMSPRRPNSLEVSIYTIKAGQKISRNMERQLSWPISLPGWLVLDYLLRNGESRLGELITFLGSKANSTEITNTLERQGLISKDAWSHDRRVKYLTITPLGRQVVEQTEPRLDEASAVLLGGLGDMELSQVRTTMSTLLGEKVTALLDRSNPHFLTS